MDNPIIDDETKKPVIAVLEETITTTTTESLPATKYLTMAINAMSSLSRLMGLNAPDKVEIDWRGELISAGINEPDKFYNELVDQLLLAAENVDGFNIPQGIIESK